LYTCANVICIKFLLTYLLTTKNRHLCTIAQICPAISLQLRHVLTIEKKLVNSNIFPMCSHNMVNFVPLAAETGSLVWAPQQISTGFASWLRYCSDVAQRKPTNLGTMFGRLLGWYTIIIHFGSSCPVTEFWQVQDLLCVQVLRSPILPSLLNGTRVVGVSQTEAFSRGRHLYSVGRPSRLALAHILVVFIFETY